MKNVIYILFALSIFSSCAPTKKLTKTETQIESELVVQVKDSTTLSSTWQSFLTTLESSIDLSTLHLISYYPQKDSITGKQLIKEEITVQKNVAVTKELKQEEKVEAEERTVVIAESTLKVKSDVKQEVITKKGTSNFKLYAIIVFLFAFVILLIYLIIK